MMQYRGEIFRGRYREKVKRGVGIKGKGQGRGNEGVHGFCPLYLLELGSFLLDA